MWPFDEIIDAINYGFDFLLGLLYLVVYLPYCVAIVFINQIIYTANLFITLINVVEGVLIHLVTVLTAVFEPLMFDSIVSWLLFGQMAIIFLWFVYDRIRGISIAGFRL